MKAVLAISGGVDSMVMLDIIGGYYMPDLMQQVTDLAAYGYANLEMVAAIFNHGTRPSAEDDVQFVRRVCNEDYFMPCFIKVDNLGEGVSEMTAREHRYDFLCGLAEAVRQSDALVMENTDRDSIRLPSPEDEPTFIYTAHHLDDLVESVAINILRGTGWRGLAVLDNPEIRRPFLEPELMPEPLRELVPFDKKTIYKYAADHKIIYRQDPTNNEDNYLRNRVRRKLRGFDKSREIYELWLRQKKLKREIDQLVNELLPAEGEPWQRSWFKEVDDKVALELLRAGALRAGVSATRPQLENFRQAILTYEPGKNFNLPQDKLVKLGKTEFYL